MTSDPTFINGPIIGNSQNILKSHQEIYGIHRDGRIGQVRPAANSVNTTLPTIPASQIYLEHSISKINLTPTSNSPQTVHHRSSSVNKVNLKRQRSTSARNRITSDFSPSSSPKSAPILSRPTRHRSANLLQQINTSPAVAIQNENSVFSKQLLPALSENMIYRRPKKKTKSNDSNGRDVLDEFVQMRQSEAMDLDLIQPSVHPSKRNLASTVAISNPILANMPGNYHNVSTSSKSRIPVIDLTSPSPEPSPVVQSEVRDVKGEADVVDLDEGVASDTELFDEYDPYFDTFEVYHTVKPLMLDAKAKTCSAECRGNWFNDDSNTPEDSSQE